MATNHICPGKVIDYPNETATPILSGGVVVTGAIVGIATVDIAVGETGVVSVSEVWEMPKKDAEAFAQGAKVYWDADGNPKVGEVGSGALTATEADGTYAGWVHEAAASGDATVAVKLIG